MMSSGPELAAVPVGAVELFDAPTAPGAVAAVAASRVWTLSVTAFFRDWVREKISPSASRREAIYGISCLFSLSNIEVGRGSLALCGLPCKVVGTVRDHHRWKGHRATSLVKSTENGMRWDESIENVFKL